MEQLLTDSRILEFLPLWKNSLRQREHWVYCPGGLFVVGKDKILGASGHGQLAAAEEIDTYTIDIWIHN